MPCSRLTCLVAVLVLAVCALPARSDEALLKDGRLLQGKLSQTEAGSLQFISNAKTVPVADIDRVTLSVNVTAFRAGPLHQVTLSNDQRLSGKLVALDAQALRLRTSWNDNLLIPRKLLVSVTHLAGLITILDDDFEAGLKSWKLTGTPMLTDAQRTSGQKSLQLAAAGQTAEFVLPKPVDAGALGINFHLPGDVAGLRCWLEAEFQPSSKRETSPVKVILAGEGDHYVVESSLDAEEADKMRRSPGWHRLALRFHERYLLVGVDDRVLYSSKQGPGGALTKLRLRCEATDADKPRGDVCFDDLSVARRVLSRVHPAGDGKQDELWLLDGDQLFGSIVKADRRSIDIRGRFGERRFPWSAVRAIYFQQHRSPHAPREATPHAEREAYHVRVTFHSGCGAQLDELEGTVAAFDEQRLTLRHADLGKLDIERARIAQIRPLK